MDAAGDFYGTTELGGTYDNGIVFKLSHASGLWKVTQLYDFPDCNIGCGAERNPRHGRGRKPLRHGQRRAGGLRGLRLRRGFQNVAAKGREVEI